ncbi:HS12A-like protein, partial [Mya arenaria]
MKLYECKKLTRETSILDQSGKEMKAMDVYSIVLQHFNKRIMQHVNEVKFYQTNEGFSSKHILWMLSIPAIWTDSARQFMREAATNAGLENVRLVLEPEAGALFAIDKPLYMREDKFAGKFPSKKLTRETFILDQTGKDMKAMDVYSIVLQYFNRAVMQQVGQVKNDQPVQGFSSKHILWMLSMPAIWTEYARKFMREAATNAGLENFKLVLEPEAGALYAVDKLLNIREVKSADKFPMKLYESKKLTRETFILDQTGKDMKAVDVYSIVLQYFNRAVMQQVGQVKNDQPVQGFSSKHILWMLSMPAIWTEYARKFMREAATNAGLENFTLVLEPEAGALFAIDKPLYMREVKSAEKFPVGHKYILADLGGGTVDICVHEIVKGRNLCELYRATGDYAGGSR